MLNSTISHDQIAITLKQARPSIQPNKDKPDSSSDWYALGLQRSWFCSLKSMLRLLEPADPQAFLERAGCSWKEAYEILN